MKKLISTLLFSFVVISAFPQWYWVNPTPIGANLADIAFVDDKTGYIVGQAGTILKTTDRGETWEYMSTGQFINYTMIRFTDEQTAYVVGDGGFLMKTTDAGETWTRLVTGMSEISDMHWIDSNTGFICGGYDTLLKTIDGGITWYNVCPELHYGRCIQSIHFPTPLVGYTSNDWGTTMKTTDGGETWTESINEPTLELRDIFFVNADTGFVAGESGYFARTYNGGASWEAFNGPVITAKKMQFTDHLNGYAIQGDELLKTTDAGNTWSPVGMNEISGYAFATDSDLFGVGYHGRLFKSEDGGITSTNYTSSVTEESFSGIHFPDENTGYAVTDLPGQVVKTIDAGNTWEIVNSGTFERLYAVWFTDASTGFVTNGSGLYKTTDGGYNWTEITGTEWKGYLQHIMFVNPLVGFVSCEQEGVIYKTMDGGATWEEIYHARSKWPRDIHFLNENVGYVATISSVLKTTDGGETFTETIFPEDNFFLSLHFPTETTGYVGSYFGKVYRTTDGGQNWTELIDTTRSYYTIDMFFVNETTGYLSSGCIYQTNDSGETWVKIDHVGDGYAKIWFTNELNGYVVGSYGNIFKTINAGAVAVTNLVKPQSQYTVFPNPTDGLLTIDNPAHKSGEPLRISIYNITGNMVFTGQYSEPLIQFDLRDYPAGMYFIQIKGTGRNEVKKVVVE